MVKIEVTEINDEICYFISTNKPFYIGLVGQFLVGKLPPLLNFISCFKTRKECSKWLSKFGGEDTSMAKVRINPDTLTMEILESS